MFVDRVVIVRIGYLHPRWDGLVDYSRNFAIYANSVQILVPCVRTGAFSDILNRTNKRINTKWRKNVRNYLNLMSNDDANPKIQSANLNQYPSWTVKPKFAYVLQVPRNIIEEWLPFLSTLFVVCYGGVWVKHDVTGHTSTVGSFVFNTSSILMKFSPFGAPGGSGSMTTRVSACTFETHPTTTNNERNNMISYICSSNTTQRQEINVCPDAQRFLHVRQTPPKGKKTCVQRFVPTGTDWKDIRTKLD